MRSIRARLKVLVALTVTLGAVGAGPMAGEAAASHFRGGDISWVQTGATSADITLRNAFRRSGYSGSASDGLPAPGDIITETIGATFLDFGDGNTTGTLQYRVDAINVAEDFLVGTALEPGSNTDTLISHAYASAGPFTANIDSGDRIGEILNSGNEYRLQTVINFTADDESPKTSVPPVFAVGNSGDQTFTVNATDAGGQTLRYRLATSAESCGASGCAQPNPPNYSINPTTGVVTFNTTGLAQGLYVSSIVVEALVGGNVVSTTQVEFLIRVQQQATNAPPVFNPPTPPDGTDFTVAPGSTLTINFNATDPNTGQTVTILNSGTLPPGSTFNATPGNPATGTFSFTPTAGQNGQDFVVNFTAQDDQSPPASVFRSYTIRVRTGTPPAGRMVGKGSVTGVGGTADYAYILRCSGPNTNAPFEVRFGSQRFRLTSTDHVSCRDNPAVPTPAIGFDHMVGEGSGTLTTGGPGRIQFVFTDGGTGGANDSVSLVIKDAAGADVFQGTARPPGKFPGSDQPTGNNTAQAVPAGR
jgi:hypothetical protein